MSRLRFLCGVLAVIAFVGTSTQESSAAAGLCVCCRCSWVWKSWPAPCSLLLRPLRELTSRYQCKSEVRND